MREEHVATIARNYPLLIPARFRLGGVDGARDRTEFGLREVRITSSWLYAEDWNSPDHREHGLSVARFVLAVRNGRLLIVWTPIAAISPHAIGRFYERSGLRDDAALIDDLAVLSNLDATGAEAFPTPSGGRWLGDRVDAQDDGRPVKLTNIRTYVV